MLTKKQYLRRSVIFTCNCIFQAIRHLLSTSVYQLNKLYISFKHMDGEVVASAGSICKFRFNFTCDLEVWFLKEVFLFHRGSSFARGGVKVFIKLSDIDCSKKLVFFLLKGTSHCIDTVIRCLVVMMLMVASCFAMHKKYLKVCAELVAVTSWNVWVEKPHTSLSLNCAKTMPPS